MWSLQKQSSFPAAHASHCRPNRRDCPHVLTAYVETPSFRFTRVLWLTSHSGSLKSAARLNSTARKPLANQIQLIERAITDGDGA